MLLLVIMIMVSVNHEEHVYIHVEVIIVICLIHDHAHFPVVIDLVVICLQFSLNPPPPHMQSIMPNGPPNPYPLHNLFLLLNNNYYYTIVNTVNSASFKCFSFAFCNANLDTIPHP